MLKPLTQYQDWRYLLRDLLKEPALRELRAVKQEQLKAALGAPVTLAHWIEQFHPELKERKSLHIIIAGASCASDSADFGKWYQLLPLFLRRPDMTIDVDLVGPELREGVTPETPTAEVGVGRSLAADCLPQLAKARLHMMKLGEFFDRYGVSAHVVFAFQPGLEKGCERWLADGELPRALRAGIPVGATAYAIDEFEQEEWLLAVHGFSVQSLGVENPFVAADASDSDIGAAWGHIMWELSPQLPETFRAPSAECLERLDAHTRQSRAFYAKYRCLPDSSGLGKLLGAPVDGGMREIATLPVGVAVFLDDGSLHVPEEFRPRVEESGLDIDQSVPAELLARYPWESALPVAFEQALWAMEVCEELGFISIADDMWPLG